MKNKLHSAVLQNERTPLNNNNSKVTVHVMIQAKMAWHMLIYVRTKSSEYMKNQFFPQSYSQFTWCLRLKMAWHNITRGHQTTIKTNERTLPASRVCLFVCLPLYGPSARFRPLEGLSMVGSCRWLKCFTAMSQTGVNETAVTLKWPLINQG